MNTPSIKGLAFASIVADVKKLAEEGRIGEQELEARLEAEDLRILAEEVQPGLWYPTACYGRLAAILSELEAGGRPRYFIERGARAAERLFAAGIYSQLTRVDQRAAELDGAGSLTRYDIRATLSLWNAMFNFTSWSYQPDPEDPLAFNCLVTGATALPEPLRLAAQGFLEYGFSRLAKSDVSVTMESRDEGQIIYHFELR